MLYGHCAIGAIGAGSRLRPLLAESSRPLTVNMHGRAYGRSGAQGRR